MLCETRVTRLVVFNVIAKSGNYSTEIFFTEIGPTASNNLHWLGVKHKLRISVTLIVLSLQLRHCTIFWGNIHTYET